jgi:hypothetical protein
MWRGLGNDRQATGEIIKAIEGTTGHSCDSEEFWPVIGTHSNSRLYGCRVAVAYSRSQSDIPLLQFPGDALDYLVCFCTFQLQLRTIEDLMS